MTGKRGWEILRLWCFLQYLNGKVMEQTTPVEMEFQVPHLKTGEYVQ